MAEPLDNRGDLDAQAVEVSAVTGGVCSKDVAVDVPTGVRKVSSGDSSSNIKKQPSRVAWSFESVTPWIVRSPGWSSPSLNPYGNTSSSNDAPT